MSIPVSITQVSSLTAGTTVSVVSTPVCLTKISVVAYTGASWLSPPASISPIGLTTAQLLPLQVTLLQTPLLNMLHLSRRLNLSIIDVMASMCNIVQCSSFHQ